MRDHVLSPGTVVIQDGVIEEIAPGSRPGHGAPEYVDCTGLNGFNGEGEASFSWLFSSS